MSFPSFFFLSFFIFCLRARPQHEHVTYTGLPTLLTLPRRVNVKQLYQYIWNAIQPLLFDTKNSTKAVSLEDVMSRVILLKLVKEQVEEDIYYSGNLSSRFVVFSFSISLLQKKTSRSILITILI